MALWIWKGKKTPMALRKFILIALAQPKNNNIIWSFVTYRSTLYEWTRFECCFIFIMSCVFFYYSIFGGTSSLTAFTMSTIFICDIHLVQLKIYFCCHSQSQHTLYKNGFEQSHKHLLNWNLMNIRNPSHPRTHTHTPTNYSFIYPFLYRYL